MLFAGVVALLLAPAPGSEAKTFNPRLANVSFSPTTPGANPDVTVVFDLPSPSANFSPQPGHLVNFGDPDVTVAGAAAIPGVGAYVGSLDATWQLGLANEGCNQQTPAVFDLVEAEVAAGARPFTPVPMLLNAAIAAGDTTVTYNHSGDPLGTRPGDGAAVNEIRIDSEEMLVTGVDPSANTLTVVRGWNGTTPASHIVGAAVSRVNVIYPAGPATNLLANLAEDDGDLDNNGTAESTEFAGNGIADGAEAVPSFVRDTLDPNGNPDDGGYIQPHARYFGMSFVANTLVTVYQTVIMAPGALTALPEMDWMITNWGYAALAFLQDPLGPPSRSAISDFCNFTSSYVLRGVTRDNACTPTAALPACTQTGAGFTLRDASDGGCPGITTPNECGSVRLTNPPTAQTIKWHQYTVSQRDWDSDQYLPELGDGHENKLDVCFGQGNSSWNPRDLNAASGQDGDGDGLPTACDPNDNQANADQDGDGWQNRLDNCPLVGNAAPGGGGGTTPNTFQLDRDVGLGTPAPDAGPRSDDIGPDCDPHPTEVNGHYHATMLARNICIGAPTPDCSASVDNDADGIANAGDNCPNLPNGPNLWGPPAGFAQSQRDFNADGQVNVLQDMAALAGRYGKVGGLPGASTGYDARFDLDYDDAIDIADVSILAEYIFGPC